MEISGSQIKLLKRLYKTDIPLSDFSESEKGEIEYLGKRGFIKFDLPCTESVLPSVRHFQRHRFLRNRHNP